jgi:hypothetical protein
MGFLGVKGASVEVGGRENEEIRKIFIRGD